MKQRKQSGGWALLIFGILLLAGAIFMILSNSELIFGQNVSNINKLLEQGTIESNVDSYIEIKIDAVLDNFAETTHKTNGITTGKDQHYMVWLDDDSVIAVSVKNKKLVTEMNRIMDETWDYLDEKRDNLTQETVEVKGKIKKMSTEMRKYYQESLDYIGVKDAGLEIHYYQVDCTTSRLTAILASAIMLVLAILLIVAFIVTRRKLNSVAVTEFEVPQGGYSYNYSYGSGQEPAASGDIRDAAGDSLSGEIPAAIDAADDRLSAEAQTVIDAAENDINIQ